MREEGEGQEEKDGRASRCEHKARIQVLQPVDQTDSEGITTCNSTQENDA